MTTKYTVTMEGLTVNKEEQHKHKGHAIAKAKKWAKAYPTSEVFILFYRSTDGQHGYINKDGAELTGKSWTS